MDKIHSFSWSCLGTQPESVMMFASDRTMEEVPEDPIPMTLARIVGGENSRVDGYCSAVVLNKILIMYFSFLNCNASSENAISHRMVP